MSIPSCGPAANVTTLEGMTPDEMTPGGLIIDPDVDAAIKQHALTTSKIAQRRVDHWMWVTIPLISGGITILIAAAALRRMPPSEIFDIGALLLGGFLCYRQACSWEGGGARRRTHFYTTAGTLPADIVNRWWAWDRFAAIHLSKQLTATQLDVFCQLAGDWQGDANTLARAVQLLDAS